MHGIGTYNYHTGDIYEGELRHGVVDGQGMLKFGNGDFYEG